jgi:hypothetical protein
LERIVQIGECWISSEQHLEGEEMSESAPIPATREELLHHLREERLAFDNLVATVPEGVAIEPNLPDGSSVKDLLAHIAAYERWTAAQMRAANEGRAPTDMELYGQESLPPEAQDWDTDLINAAIREQYQDLTYAEAREFAGSAFNELVEAIESTSEDDLLRSGAQSWVQEANLMAAIPDQSYVHYAMHMDELKTVAGRMA